MESVPKPGENTDVCTWKGVPVICGPRGLPPGSGSLYRNNGDGTFTDVSTASGVAKAQGSYLMTAVAADFDNDGWPDIYVACDSTPSFLFRNNHDGTFHEDIGLECGVRSTRTATSRPAWAWRIGDFNLDGNLDILKTHFADDTSVLYRNNGKGNFDDVRRSGLARRGDALRRLGRGHRGPGQRWQSGSVPGHRRRLPGSGANVPAYPMKTPRVIFRNLGNGRFEELIENAGPASRRRTAAAAARSAISTTTATSISWSSI